jgi:SAM-dependent methyltransferase
LNRIKRDVESVYDEISPQFLRKRDRLWPPMSSFLDEISPCRLGDLGCGTGRGIRRGLELGCEVVGVDISSQQLETAREHIVKGGHFNRYRLLKGDLEDLPIEDGSLDGVLMIASLHHLPTIASRVRAQKEVCRVLTPGGKALISVWTWDQDRFRESHLDRITQRREENEMDGPLEGDFMVPWREGKEVLRFYHLYGPGELEDEISRTSLILRRSYFDGRNHWVEVEKSNENNVVK